MFVVLLVGCVGFPGIHTVDPCGLWVIKASCSKAWVAPSFEADSAQRVVTFKFPEEQARRACLFSVRIKSGCKTHRDCETWIAQLFRRIAQLDSRIAQLGLRNWDCETARIARLRLRNSADCETRVSKLFRVRKYVIRQTTALPRKNYRYGNVFRTPKKL